MLSADDRIALTELDARLKTLLPEDYQASYEDVAPAPMKSAALKYGDDGRVAWNDIWGSFCNLAMAGGPPHKGALLEPASPQAVASSPDSYQDVVSEVCRGVEMVTTMPCEPAPQAGWVRVECYSAPMASWLLRAIVMENVAARAEGVMLDLPVSPAFRLEKEIKNVVTVIAKTTHYWLDHMPRSQHRAIAALFTTLAQDAPLVAPSFAGSAAPVVPIDALGAHIERLTGLRPAPPRYEGWLGLECPSVRAAVWMMRALVGVNVLSRREDRVLFVPVNPELDPNGARVAAAVARIKQLAVAKHIMEGGTSVPPHRRV